MESLCPLGLRVIKGCKAPLVGLKVGTKVYKMKEDSLGKLVMSRFFYLWFNHTTPTYVELWLNHTTCQAGLPAYITCQHIEAKKIYKVMTRKARWHADVWGGQHACASASALMQQEGRCVRQYKDGQKARVGKMVWGGPAHATGVAEWARMGKRWGWGCETAGVSGLGGLRASFVCVCTDRGKQMSGVCEQAIGTCLTHPICQILPWCDHIVWWVYLLT